MLYLMRATTFPQYPLRNEHLYGYHTVLVGNLRPLIPIKNTKQPQLRFHALPTDGTQEVRFERISES